MIYIFYHIYCNEFTESVLNNQIQKIHFSGLYTRIDKIYCFLVGPDTFRLPCETLIQEAGSKFCIEKVSSNDTSYERFTLLQIPNYIQPSDKFLYLHTKGITRNKNKEEQKRVEHWRTLLEYFCMVHHDLCIRSLDSHDVVGCNYRVDVIPITSKEKAMELPKGQHFSGNIYWSTGKYFLSLPKMIGPHYLDPEIYIGTNNPNFKCLYETWINHYSDDLGFYPFKHYVDLKQSQSIQFAFL
jgi:hypothetical protein